MNETILEYPLESLQPNYDQHEGGALHELALFAGVGGGLLGTKLLGWRAVCYVEWNEYCIEVLKARIKDGYLDDAPIWDDVSTFDGQPWRGKVDVITAGFPCQPFSIAGKRKGEADHRNKWPDTIRIIREVRPRYVFLENVPNLLANQYIHTIFRELAESGYDCQWDCIRASDVGAPHRRERLWIVAYAKSKPQRKQKNTTNAIGIIGAPRMGTENGCVDVAYPESTGLGRKHTSGLLTQAQREGQRVRRSHTAWWAEDPADAAQSRVGRLAHGISDRVERQRAIGNAQVPAVVTTAWRMLTQPDLPMMGGGK